MNSGTFEMLILTDSRDWIDELSQMSDTDSPHICWRDDSGTAIAAADWGLTASAPEAVRKWVKTEIPFPVEQFDLGHPSDSIHNYDLILSLHARQIFSPELVRQRPCVNLHPGLPHQRGWVPYSWAILAGESRSGCNLHRMQDRIDRGHVFDQTAIAIEPTDTAGSLRERIMAAERELFHSWIPHRIPELLGPAGAVDGLEAPLRTQAEWIEECRLKPEDLDLIRKLRAMTFAPDHSEAWYDQDGTRYRVAVRILRDET